MRELRSWRKGMAIAAVLALTATACGNGDDPGEDPDATGTPPATDETDDPDATGPPTGEIETGTGVTEEPCPDPVNEDNGCIYLGVLSDLTEGPFAALANPIVDGQELFWNRVNEAGGIAGFDINISEFTRDNKYNPQTHVSEYQAIEPEILAIAQSLGTPPTLAALELYKQDNMIAVPASWWSGWSVPETDQGVILESGYPYCIESMNGLDHLASQGDISAVMAVGYPGDYGGDGAAGVEEWATANEVAYGGFTQTAPNAVAGNQDGAVGAILGADPRPDVVQLGVGPAEAAEIVGKAVAQGFEGTFMGSVPTWNPALLGSDAAPALLASYIHVGPWGPFGSDTAAHDAMAEALGGDLPDNDGFTFGWIWSYSLKALLEKAAGNGTLTREGLLAAVDGLEVDYEGALPTRTLGGSANDTVVRSAVISQPDEDAPLGLTVIEENFTGPTAEAYQFDAPCASAG